ncbi:cyclic nucleotide-gated cation channel subunit A-like [Tachypleus tridentatus]|uniref:cyclic nucleotide-gated cation channel subunit A-like n=1 Tax=Tachypleus tridentatus TaxID=6853 RepID=UPI003FD4ADEB
MRSNDTGKTVKYTKEGLHLDDELNEIVVGNAEPESVEYRTGSNGPPRVIPGIITSTGSERVRLVPDEGPVANSARPQARCPLCSAKSSENLNLKSASRQSLLEILGSKFHTGDMRQRSRDSVAFLNKAHINSELEVSRKTREQRRKEIKREFEKMDTSASGSDRNGCNWTFVFDPSGKLCYYWSMIVSIAFLYNLWVIIYRFSFQEINKDTLVAWFTLDYITDFLYILDICFHFRAGYLEEGVLQTDYDKLRKHYMNSTMFYIDCLCLLPLDFLYLSIGFNSILRCLRLVKIYRFWAFLDRTERHTNYPNVFRTLSLIHYFLVILHWNACLFHIISINGGFGSRDWFNSRGENCIDVLCEYLHSFYWSTLAWTTVGDLPRPRTRGEYMFLILELVFGLFFFAAVLGHVANIVTNVSAARKEFQAKLDAVKIYMRMRRVPDHLQNKVIKWFDYLWMTQKSSDEERSVGCLPDKLKAEIAIHVHLDTLKRVEIFQNTEAGFLCELVLRLRPVLFSPGDYICRKGEVGKEMFIVNHGRLEVVTDNGKTVLATLRAGSYFGEISILNMGTAGNRRTASVRSVGYSDLFCLYKHDMWDVLKDYPAARVRLEAIAVKRLEKYRKDPLRKIAMGRSRSTPGMVESCGRVSLEEMQVDPRDSSASTSYLLADEVPQKMTEVTAPPRDVSSTNKACSRKINNGEAYDKTFTQYESLEPIPSIMYIPESQRTASNCSFAIGDSKDKKQGLEGISQSKLFCLRPTSPYFSQSLAFNMLNGSPMTKCSVLSSTSTDQVFFGGPQLHSNRLCVPSPVAGGSEDTSSISINTSREYHQGMLLSEIKRLREQLLTLEAENASMSRKHIQQQWEVENKLAEIELQICSISSTSVEDSERNQESAI